MTLPSTLETITPAFLIGFVAVFMTFWKGDEWISEAGRKKLFSAIKQAISEPERSTIFKTLESLLAHHFGRGLGSGSFFGSALLLTLVSMFVFLGLYTINTPDLSGQLLTEGFLSQFFGNGFVVTFLTNCVAFAVYPRYIKAIAGSSIVRNLWLIILDFLIKAVVFVALTVFTYYLFALLSGAFGNNIRNVLSVASKTILLAIQFKNLTGVYIYSLALSSLPIYLVALIKFMAVSPKFSCVVQTLLFWLPIEDKPVRVAALVLSIFGGFFCSALILVISGLQVI